MFKLCPVCEVKKLTGGHLSSCERKRPIAWYLYYWLNWARNTNKLIEEKQILALRRLSRISEELGI